MGLNVKKKRLEMSTAPSQQNENLQQNKFCRMYVRFTVVSVGGKSYDDGSIKCEE